MGKTDYEIRCARLKRQLQQAKERAREQAQYIARLEQEAADIRALVSKAPCPYGPNEHGIVVAVRDICRHLSETLAELDATRLDLEFVKARDTTRGTE